MNRLNYISKCREVDQDPLGTLGTLRTFEGNVNVRK
jgi:hypothetical protein